MPLNFMPLWEALGSSTPSISHPTENVKMLFRAYAVLDNVLQYQRLFPSPVADAPNRVSFTAGGGWIIIVEVNEADKMWNGIADMITPGGASLCEKFGWPSLEVNGPIYEPTEQELDDVWSWPSVNWLERI